MPPLHIALVQDRRPEFQGIGHREHIVAMAQQAAIAQLTTGFGIEGSIRQHDEGLIPLMDHRDFCILLDQVGDDIVAGQLVITNELALLLELQPLVVVNRKVGGTFAPLTLLFHLGLETGFIDGVVTIPHHIGGQIRREAIGIVELEDHLSWHHLGIAQIRQRIFEQRQTTIQSANKLLFFLLEHPLDHRLLAVQLRISITHLLGQFGHQSIEENILSPQFATVTHGAADDATQDIAASLIGGHDTIGDQECAGTDVVGNDAQRLVRQIVDTDDLRGPLDQCLENIDFVVGMNALHDGGDTLNPHTGIHRRFGQRLECTIGLAVELHEDHVPDLDEAIAILFG